MENSKGEQQLCSKDGNKEQDEKLLQPFTYLLQMPGKNVRSKLSRAFNYWLNIPEDKAVVIEDIIQMLHNASLLLDDIEDSSILRRGIPVAHSIYGTASTINAANYAMFIALERCLQLNHAEATTVYTEQLLELHRGQGMEIYWRDNFICPSETEYSEMTKKKTGGLFMLAIRLMQLFSTNKQDYSKLAGILGLYFQIRDDYLNLVSEDYMINKSYCEDLTEGKFSYLLIHAINNQPNDNQVMPLPMGIFNSSGTELKQIAQSAKKILKVHDMVSSMSAPLKPQLLETRASSLTREDARLALIVQLEWIHEHLFEYILRQRTKDNEVKRYCVSLLERCGSFEYTRNKLKELDQEARDEVRRLGGNPIMEEFINYAFKLQEKERRYASN